MRSVFTLLAIGSLCGTTVLCGQGQSATNSSGEAKAFAAIEALMSKARQGDDTPTQQDLAVRRQVGMDMAKQGKQFLVEYPSSEKAEDARALTGIGLYEAALAGSVFAEKELSDFAAATMADPKLSDMVKLHAFALNHLTSSSKAKGKGSLNQGAAEFQRAYREAFFAAAEVLADKDAIFKMLLLQAKSGRELAPSEKRTVAQRVLNNPSASESIKAEAQKILSGEQPYAVGKPLDISFTAVDGWKVDLKQMKGKVVLIDFWATWCGPCVAEVPSLKKVYDEYHSRGFEIIGISLDDNKKELAEFIKKHDMAWPQYFDGKHWNNEISFRFGINSVPTQWLVDKKGILRALNARHDLSRAVEGMLKEQ